MSDLEASMNSAEQTWIDEMGRGPSAERMRTNGPGIGEPAPDVELTDSRGSSVLLSDFWSEGPALLLFWRHFGCGCGMDRAERLAGERPELADAGARIVLIGMGDPARTADYAQRFEITEPFLCDPERAAYRAYGVPEGNTLAVAYDDDEVLVGDADVWRSVIGFKRDRGTRLVDSPWQLPGEFVVSEGVVRMAYRYQYCDNFPDPRLALSAIKELTAGLDPMRAVDWPS